ncbi:MAG: class poly(R)-hydroxyalkanoic acid synthase, partial [Microvirga sp.]|nr:class poly(R)-hydroxyalkanoic acid synthase [Microvirga sp.]
MSEVQPEGNDAAIEGDRLMDKPYGEEKTQGPIPDFEELSHNVTRFIEGAGKAAAAYLKPVQEGRTLSEPPPEASEAIKSLTRVAEAWMTDPQRSLEAQTRLGTQFMSLWASTLKRAQGEPAEPVAEPEPKDNRF